MATQIGNALNSLSDPAQDALVQLENNEILDFHASLEAIADETPLFRTLHGITSTGESVGLGKVGGANLITDVAQAPGDTLNGVDLGTTASQIATDAGNTVDHVGSTVSGLGADLSDPDLVPNSVDGATSLVNDLSGALPGAGPCGVGGVGGIGDVVDAGNLGDLGGLLNSGGTSNGGGSGSGDPLISVGAGEGGGTPILDAGLLHTAPGDSPIGFDIGSGNNLLAVDGLSGEPAAGENGDSLVLSSTVGSEAWNSRDLKSRPH